MRLDQVTAEIAHMRVQIKRQQRDIALLNKAGIETTSAAALLERMQDKTDELCEERDRLVGEERLNRRPIYATGKPIKGTPSRRRGL